MKKRFPPLAQILPVYAVIVFLMYGWTLMLVFWKLPSWLLSLTAWEIVSILAYSFALNLVESLFFLGLLLGAGAVLPGRILRHDFAARGASFMLVVLASMMLHLALYADTDLREAFILSLLPWWAVSLLAAVLFVALTVRWARLRTWLLEFSDRLIVFLYLFLPLSFISLIIAVARNIR